MKNNICKGTKIMKVFYNAFTVKAFLLFVSILESELLGSTNKGNGQNSGL